MNAHGVLLDMQSDSLIFVPGRCSHPGAPDQYFASPHPLPDLRITPASETPPELRGISPKQAHDMLQSKVAADQKAATERAARAKVLRPESNPTPSVRTPPVGPNFDKATNGSLPRRTNAKPLNVAMIGAATFYRLNSARHKVKGVKCYSMTMNQIDSCLQVYRIEVELKEAPVEVNEAEEAFTKKLTMKKVKKMLHSNFHDLLKAFDPAAVEKLAPHRLYDHKIELIDDSNIVRSRVYSLSYVKLQKLKKYLEKNLRKDFINLNNFFYSSSMLFAIKFNDALRFCVDYRKLNVIIKRNRYFIFLIDETLVKLINCKYITKLNVIVVFNKLRMNLVNEKFITFICSLNAYKYHVLSFDLINESINYQHYMNDIFFDFLNDFVQCYLDDILIYSKTRKKHTQHVRLMFQRLIKIELQIDIKKSQFYVQKTKFLEVLIFIERIRMNLKKVTVIVD